MTKIKLTGVQIGSEHLPFNNLLQWSTATGEETFLKEDYDFFGFSIESNNIRFYYLRNHSSNTLYFYPIPGTKFLSRPTLGDIILYQTLAGQTNNVIYLLNDNTQDSDPNQLLVSSNFFELELS